MNQTNKQRQEEKRTEGENGRLGIVLAESLMRRSKLNSCLSVSMKRQPGECELSLA